MSDKLKIYIAAPWVYKDSAKSVARQFEAAGFEISSRWHDKHHEGPDGDKDHALLEREAIDDLEDVWNSNGMVVLQLKKSEGKAFEQGFMLGISGIKGMKNKLILVSLEGERGNVFQYLSDIYTLVPTVDAAIEECQKWPGYIRDAEIVTNEIAGPAKDPDLQTPSEREVVNGK